MDTGHTVQGHTVRRVLERIQDIQYKDTGYTVRGATGNRVTIPQQALYEHHIGGERFGTEDVGH